MNNKIMISCRWHFFTRRAFLLRAFLWLLWLGISSATYGQRFGNEWINPNQTYFKISVAANGIYRLNYADLQEAGFPVNNIDPRRIQLFFRGKEQAILLEGQQDARFDLQDYLLFYGRRNDGTMEKELYVTPEAQPHPYYSLYSDTASYYLTWRLDAVNGKRMVYFAENNIDGMPAEAYHREEQLMLLTQEYSLGRQYPIGSTLNNHLSTFDYGEGWTGPRIQKGQPADYVLQASRQVNTGSKPRLEILLAGRNNLPHKVSIQIGGSATTLRTLAERTFNYYDNTFISEIIEWSDISSGQLLVRITPMGVEGLADNVSVSYIRLTYPQATDASLQESKVFYLKANSKNKSYVEISNPPSDALLLDITRADEPVHIGFNSEAAKLNAVVPQTALERTLYMGTVQENVPVKKVDFIRIDPAANFLIISHPLLRQAAGKYSDPVKAYGDYRTSAVGGGFKVLSLDIQQLFDQFNYGDVSPLAVRRFADYMLTQGNPQHLLLMGKGLTIDHNYHRQDPALSAIQNLVLTGGVPGSDVVFTAGLKGSDGIGPAIPTGRVNARNAKDVVAYLEKVKERESRTLQTDYQAANTREALWQKHLVHLSGGVTANEQKLFSIYVDQLESKAAGNFLGGKVATLSKTTNNATELINISEEVNKGLSLVTFFGHSSATRTDIEVGYVSNNELGYRNKGKYPAVLINGCNAGNIFSSAFTFGEDWIVTPERGAMHVLAHSAEGLSNVLKMYSSNFYEVAFQDSTWIEASLGQILTETNKKFIEDFHGTESEVHRAQVQQMVLQGDPSVLLFGKSRPDYDISTNSLFFSSLDNHPVTAYSDSFAVHLIVKNYGATARDSLGVSIRRTLNSGKVITYGPVYYPPVLYEDTLHFVIHNTLQKTEGFGINRFEAVLDEADSIQELNKNNNRASVEYFLPLGGTVNVLPYSYAIVNQPEVLLQAQPGDLQGAMQENKPRSFLFEADTSIHFNSPAKMSFSTQAVSLASWPLVLPVVEDSIVYYWRTRFAELRPGEIDAWTQSSFAFVKDSPKGWAQLRAAQLTQNEISQLTCDNGQWQFVETSIDIDITTYGGDNQDNYPQFSVSGKQFLLTSVDYLKCRDHSINGVAFEKESLKLYAAIPPKNFDVLDPDNCGPLPQVINTFSNAQVSSNFVLEEYIDGVYEGDAVLLFTIGLVEFQSWPASTWTRLSDIGVDPDDILNMQDGEPLIILGRKGGDPGTAQVIRADAGSSVAITEQMISLQEEVTGKYSSGTVISEKIGPASAWFSLQHAIQAQESGSDEVTLRVKAETLSGGQIILFDDVAATPSLDLSQVDAAQYPYLQLEYTVRDKVNLTPPQLRKWLVTYAGVPEGVIWMSEQQELSKEKQEGDSDEVALKFYNIADVNFADSVAVVYSFFNQEMRKTETDTLKVAPLSAGDTASFTIPVSTLGRVGTNDLRVSVNPRLQREQSYDNNQITLNSFLTVKADKTHPVIDVAFDGVYIMDGDIVAPNPMITLELRDENPYLLKQDTSGIELYLYKAEGAAPATGASNARISRSQAGKVNLSAAKVNWTPATKERPFQMTYQPEPLEDGKYTLRVQASDASGNTAGSQPYEVSFEVINASSITHFYPYPNPFSSSTRFVFTLTGAEIPEQIKIQIMTVSGKIVREITQDEIGPIHIGNNISAYAWDGRDEYGDRLANGVYLYRVLVMHEGRYVEHRETAADRAFRHGFGKLYILR